MASISDSEAMKGKGLDRKLHGRVMSMSNDLATVVEDSARGGFFLMLGNILATVISAIAVFIVARLLGPELYGLYTLSLVIPSLLLLLVDFGISQGLTKFSASLRVKGESKRVAKITRYGLLFKTLIGAITVAICLVFSNYLAKSILNRPDVEQYIRLASSAIIFQAIFTTANSVFVGLDKTEYNALVQDTQALVKAITSPLLVILGFSLLGAIWGFVTGCIAAGLLSVYLLYSKVYRHLDPDSDDGDGFVDSLKTLVSYGYPLYFSAILVGFIPQYQSLILALFTSDADIGNFKAAMNFATLISMCSIPIATTLFPSFSKLESKDEEVKKFFKLSVKYTTLIILPITVVIILFSGEIVHLVYGPSYQSAPYFLSLYVALYFLVGLGYVVLCSFFSGIGQTRIALNISLVNFLLFFTLAPILTQLCKVTGLIVAFLISNSSGMLYGSHVAKSRFKAELGFKTLTRVYAVSLASAMPALLLSRFFPSSNLLRFFLGASTYLCSYLILIPLAGVITQPELEKARQVLERVKPLKPFIKSLINLEEKILSIHPQKPM